MNGYDINPMCICLTHKDHSHTYITDPEEIKRFLAAQDAAIEEARKAGKETIVVSEVKDGQTGQAMKLTIKDYT